MRILNANSINTPEHYNQLWTKKGLKPICTSMPRAEALLKHFKGGKFLDAGCGLGIHSDMASKVPNSDVYALDFSDRLIESLRYTYPHIKYTVGDVNHLPYNDSFFDYIILGEVLEHMDDPNITLKEMMRTLKPNGILAVSVPYKDRGSCSPNEHRWSFDEGDIHAMLSKLGKCEEIILTEPRGYIIGHLTKC
jgi:ubiquinone/menaquinone biosynthesis C-methylase UbiE